MGVQRLDLPQPFHKVLDPAPELNLKARMAALRHCCASAPDKVLQQAAANKDQSLLAALRHVKLGIEDSQEESRTKAIRGRKRSENAGTRGKQHLTQNMAQQELNAMLAEAAD